MFELSEFLVGELGVDDVGAYYAHPVTYHPSCHGLRMLRTGDAPLRLLRNHTLVPAIHRNRAEIRELFRARLPGTEQLTDEPDTLISVMGIEKVLPRFALVRIDGVQGPRQLEVVLIG